MPSTLTATTACAALLFLLTVDTHARSHDHSTFSRKSFAKRDPAMTYQGCFSASSGLTDQGSYQYQTNTYCQPICTGKNQAVFALSGGSDCWCGDVLPPANSKVDDSNCNTPCFGFGSQNCGGTNFWSVYLSGTTASAPNFDGSSSSSAASSSSASSSSSAPAASSPAAAASSSSSSLSTVTSAAPIVVTSVAPGSTVVVTEPAAHETSAPATPTPENKGTHTNVAGIAAGVVVGVLALAALIGGLVLFLRHRHQQAADDEHKRSTQVRDFMRGGSHEPKPPGTGYSNMSDMRLDPETGRRNSAGSIADDQDYSRKILRVANPDDS